MVDIKPDLIAAPIIPSLSRQLVQEIVQVTDTPGLYEQTHSDIVAWLAFTQPPLEVPVTSQSVLIEGKSLSITDCPPGMSKLVEYQRTINYQENRFTSETWLNSVFAAVDGNGQVVGSIGVIGKDFSEQSHIQFETNEQAINHVGISLLHHVSDADVQRFVQDYQTFFGQESEFTLKSGNGAPALSMPLEYGIKIMHHADLLADDTVLRNAWYEALGNPNIPMDVIMAIDSKEDIRACLAFQANAPRIQFQGEQISFATLVNQMYGGIIRDAEQSELHISSIATERPLTNHLVQKATKLFQNSMRHFNTDWYKGNEELVIAAYTAMHDAFNILYDLPLPPGLVREDQSFNRLSEFVQANARNPQAMQIASAVLDEYRFTQVKGYIPEAFEKKGQFFYQALGDELSAHASETTGDDEKQIAMQIAIMQWASKEGIWKKGGVYIEQGAGDGKRTLQHVLDSDIMKEFPPSAVYAVDINAYPDPPDGRWKTIQKSFTDPDFVATFPKKADIESCMWSPINDADAFDHEGVLKNFAELLNSQGILILDIPAGYFAEMQAYMEQHGRFAMGRIEKEFPGKDGAKIRKEFDIEGLPKMLVRAFESGLMPVNLGPDNPIDGAPALYTTQAGQERAMLVLQKVGDPVESIEGVVKQYFQKPS